MKGISPVISVSLLIVIVVILVGIFLEWNENLVRNLTGRVEKKSKEVLKCSAASIQILDYRYSGKKLYFTVKNSGDVKLDFLKLLIMESDGSYREFVLVSDFESGVVRSFEVELPQNFVGVLLKTECSRVGYFWDRISLLS